MKKIFTLFVLIIIWFYTSAQDQNEQRLPDTIKYTYCEIVGASVPMSHTLNVIIDFGQKLKFGDVVSFNTMIDALNNMSSKGWLFVQAYALVEKQNSYIYHYILKKPTRLLSEEEKKGNLDK